MQAQKQAQNDSEKISFRVIDDLQSAGINVSVDLQQ
jgi:hypothetical protein